MTSKEMKKLRIKAEMRVIDLAKETGLSRSIIYYYEEGYRKISPISAQKIRRVLNAKILEINSLN